MYGHGYIEKVFFFCSSGPKSPRCLKRARVEFAGGGGKRHVAPPPLGVLGSMAGMPLRRDCHWTSVLYVQELVCCVLHKIHVACSYTGGGRLVPM